MYKPFISKKNPFNESSSDGETFSYKYLLPIYWPTWILLGLSFFVVLLPNSLRTFLGDLIGIIIYRYSKSKKSIVEINLNLTFNNIDAKQLEKLSKSFFNNLGQMYINLPLLWWKSNEYLQSIITKKNTKLIDDVLKNNQSVILLAPHSLSLDFGGRALSAYNLLSMYKPFKNNLLNWFIGKSRSKNNDKVIVYPRDTKSIKTIIRKMRQPCVLYLLADEDISVDNSVFSNFFDTNKASLKSVSKLAKITNSKVLPCICTYNKYLYNYTFEVFPALNNFPSNNIEIDCQKVNSILEEQILVDKSQYMWTLRIYKHRPDGSDVYKI